MSGTILPEALSTFVDANGKPLAGGSVYMYIPNTSTPKNTWQDVNLTILNTNPIILNASGQAAIWGSGQYRQVVYDQFNNLIWDAITEDTSAGLAGNMTDNTYLSGPGFTPGTTTQLTLSTGPGSAANIWVFFDGVFQTPDTWNLNITTNVVTFNSPIPVGVQEVNIKVGSTVAIGTPGTGTVTDASVAANAGIQSSKLAFLQAGTGAVSRTVQSKLRDTVSVTDFGAKLDGVTDDTAAFNAALATGRPALVPYTATGALINGTVTIGTGQFLQFESPAMTIYAGASSNGRPIRLTGYGVPSGIMGGCTFNMNGAPVNSSAITFGTSSGVVYMVHLYGRITFLNCYSAIAEETSAANYVVDVVIDDVMCENTLGRQLTSLRSRGFYLLRSFQVDWTGNPTVVTYGAALFQDCAGIELERFDAYGGVLIPGQTYQNVAALAISGGPGDNVSVWLKRVLIDNTPLNGVLMTDVYNLIVDEIESYQNWGYGIYLSTFQTAQFQNIFVYGGVGLPSAAAAEVGVDFVSGSNLQIGNVISQSNTGSGVALTNVNYSTTANWQANGNQAVGWIETGTSNFNIKTNGISFGNTAGSLTQVGAASACCNWIANAGSFRSSDVGAITV